MIIAESYGISSERETMSVSSLSRISLLLISIALVRSGNAQSSAPSATPTYVAAHLIESRYGKAIEAHPTPLTESIRQEILTSITALPRFPDYLFSGCHDRAHAAYLLLPDSLKQYSAKMWLFAPERYTAGIRGTITLRENSQRSSESGVSWGYHVALAFRDSAGTVYVFDPALSPDRLVTREEWFDLMVIPALAFWTLAPGSTYSFFSTLGLDLTNNESRNGNIFNGGMFDYTGAYFVERWIPRALARDAVGELVMKDQVCQELESLEREPGILQDRLDKNSVPAACTPALQLYREELVRWTRLLDGRG